jgi:hypothetical protein
MNTRIDDALRRVLTDPALFSRLVIAKRELRPYQVQVQKAILTSIFAKQGTQFSFMMARQMGKNETMAQLECYLLNLFQRVGGQIIHGAPTFNPQCVMAKTRLDESMDNPWNATKYHSEWGRAITLGKARVQFLSGDPNANHVGMTATILLGADEFQDWTPGTWEKDFRPMGATTNTTAVAWGTAWADDDPLACIKTANLDAQKVDHLQRHFEFDWNILAAINPAYRAYVESEIERLGFDHPIIRTQYRLLTIGSGGRLLNATQLAQMQGEHPAQTQRTSADCYVAGLDLAGEEEQTEDANTVLKSRDAVTLTIGRVTHRDLAPGLTLPVCSIAARYEWTGLKHTELYPTILDLLNRIWKIDLLAIDATGVGAGMNSFLTNALGEDHVLKCVFDSAWSLQSELAFNFLAMINSGRYLEHTPPEDNDIQRKTWSQFKLAKAKTRPGNKMMIHVDEKDGHDDLLISAALCAHAATQVAKHVDAAGTAAAPPRAKQKSRY